MVATLWLASQVIPVQGGVSNLTGDQILAMSDKVRNAAAAFEVMSTLVEYRKGVAQSSAALRVYSKLDPQTGQYRNLARYVAPARDRGKMFLMNGEVMWFYDPAASTSIRISPQQRLLGEASVGDVLSLNFSKNFSAQLLGEEHVEGADRKPVEAWHLNLKAKNSSVIYARVEYWLQKDTYRPVKGYFYSDSGRKLKVAYYMGFQHVIGGVRATQVVILDDVDRSLATEITFSDIQSVDVPDNWFQHEYLPHLR